MVIEFSDDNCNKQISELLRTIYENVANLPLIKRSYTDFNFQKIDEYPVL
jgi:hypothetical protein